MSTKPTILVLCIILYSVNQALSLKCYACSSKSDGACYTNPKKEEFQKECSLRNNVKSASAFLEISNSTLPVTRANFSTINDVLPMTSDSMECYTATGSEYIVNVPYSPIDKTHSDFQSLKKVLWRVLYMGKYDGTDGKLIVRDCINKIYSDDYIKQLANIANATTESIYRCNTDLCNSSSNLSIKLSSLIISTLFIFSIKR